jgi:hypothetical protein
MQQLRELSVQYIVDANGDKSAVILPIEQYYQLLEDLDDLAVLAERRFEPTISHDELLAELEDLRDARHAQEMLEKIRHDPSRLRPLEDYINELIARGELDPDFAAR